MVNPVALGLSFVGVALMAVAYRNRENPEWRRDLRAIIVLAIGQVLLGTVLAIMDVLAK